MTLEQFFISKNIEHSWSNYEVMCLAIINGLITSFILETIILLRQMSFYSSLKKALGMSFISMIDMVASMNITDLILTGGTMLTVGYSNNSNLWFLHTTTLQLL